MSIDPAFTNSYNWEKEDKSFIASLPDVPMTTSEWESFSRPDHIDVNWHKPEDQGQIGSCQGNALTSVLERLMFFVAKACNYSRIISLFATQK